jgi:transposase
MERLAEPSGESVIAGAIRYALGLCEGLVRFLDDGRIEIDSNTVERSMRPVALNRKNALSADSDQGGANWALLGVADRDLQAHVNPQAWLTDVLTELANNWPNSRLEDVIPWAWSARQTRQREARGERRSGGSGSPLPRGRR